MAIVFAGAAFIGYRANEAPLALFMAALSGVALSAAIRQFVPAIGALRIRPPVPSGKFTTTTAKALALSVANFVSNLVVFALLAAGAYLLAASRMPLWAGMVLMVVAGAVLGLAVLSQDLSEEFRLRSGSAGEERNEPR